MNDALHAWVYPEGEEQPVPCGALTLIQGRRCLFSYDAAWLAHPKAFTLSPDMPLRAGVIAPPAGLDLHPIFEDAGPDRWEDSRAIYKANLTGESGLSALERHIAIQRRACATEPVECLKSNAGSARIEQPSKILYL